MFMKENYMAKYNSVEYGKILKLLGDDKYIYALEELEKYMKKYPKDVGAKLCYAKIYFILGDIKTFKQILNSISDINSIQDKKHFMYLKIREFLYEARYRECYDYIKSNIDIFYNEGNRDTDIMTFLMQKLNIIDATSLYMPSYFLKQIVEYSYPRLLEHISKYLVPNMKGYNFNPDFPLEKVLERIKIELPQATPFYDNELTTSYLFRYDKVGTVDGKEVNYLKVFTFLNTYLITTIQPYDNKGKLSYTDINDLKYQDESNSKVKTLSQVEKFKKRYNLN